MDSPKPLTILKARKHNLIFFYFIFLAALDLRCCAPAFSSCGEWVLVFNLVCELLMAVASRVAARELSSAPAQ